MVNIEKRLKKLEIRASALGDEGNGANSFRIISLDDGEENPDQRIEEVRKSGFKGTVVVISTLGMDEISKRPEVYEPTIKVRAEI